MGGPIRRHAAMIAMACASCAGPAPHSPAVPGDGETVAMLDFGGRPMVEVLVDGKGPYRFIFDTGAMVTVVDSALAHELSPDGTGAIAALDVGRVRLRDPHVAIAPISSLFGVPDAPRGVLSALAFPGSLVTFDYPARRIAFRAGALPPADGKRIFDYRGADLPSVPVRVAGREITVHLDTGAPYAVAFPTRYMKELPLAAPAVQKGSARSHAGSVPIFVATAQSDVSVGEFTLPTRELRFTDIVPFGAAEPKGQVGGAALRDFVVTVDSLGQRVRFERPPAAASR